MYSYLQLQIWDQGIVKFKHVVQGLLLAWLKLWLPTHSVTSHSQQSMLWIQWHIIIQFKTVCQNFTRTNTEVAFLRNIIITYIIIINSPLLKYYIWKKNYFHRHYRKHKLGCYYSTFSYYHKLVKISNKSDMLNWCNSMLMIFNLLNLGNMFLLLVNIIPVLFSLMLIVLTSLNLMKYLKRLQSTSSLSTKLSSE